MATLDLQEGQVLSLVEQVGDQVTQVRQVQGLVVQVGQVIQVRRHHLQVLQEVDRQGKGETHIQRREGRGCQS